MESKHEIKEKLEAGSFGAVLIMNNQIVPILSNVLNLGRHIENDVVIGSETVSRRHSHIRFEHGQFVLYDNNSTGGTFVNNRKIDRCILNSGDLISLADIKIMFVQDRSQLTDITKRSTRSFEDSDDHLKLGNSGEKR